jgi:phosphatidylglycerol:prolipoprotein diacylglycerol transferase
MQTTVLFRIGQLDFYTHGVFAVLGIIVAAIMTYLLAKKRLDCTFLFDNFVYSVLVGIIGARITFFILYRDQFDSWKQLFYLWQGGLVSYGGFILGAVTFWLLLRKQKQPPLEWFDLLGVTFPLGLFFGRLGEYISGENFGVASPSVLGTTRFVPINLYESLLCLTIAVVLLGILAKARKTLSGGTAFSISVMLYTIGRFIIDFWRDDEKIFYRLSLSQITSLSIFVVSLIILLLINKRGRYARA